MPPSRSSRLAPTPFKSPLPLPVPSVSPRPGLLQRGRHLSLLLEAAPHRLFDRPPALLLASEDPFHHGVEVALPEMGGLCQGLPEPSPHRFSLASEALEHLVGGFDDLLDRRDSRLIGSHDFPDQTLHLLWELNRRHAHS